MNNKILVPPEFGRLTLPEHIQAGHFWYARDVTRQAANRAITYWSKNSVRGRGIVESNNIVASETMHLKVLTLVRRIESGEQDVQLQKMFADATLNASIGALILADKIGTIPIKR